MRVIALLCLAPALLTLGCDSMELVIGVEPGPNATLVITNANDRDWTDARLLVEAVESDNSTTVCTERRIGNWEPEQKITIPACGAKIRLTLTTEGETARFAYANGQLFRRFGRKEVPVSS